jgi:type I restriction enzyme S subunit
MSIATYPKYGSYRNSDIDWIPKLPSHWCTQRSKFLFKQSKELARKGDIQLSATQSHSVIPQADYEAMIGRKVTQIQTNLEKRKHVEVDDFVISMRSFQGGLERAKAVGCIRSSYVILKPSSLVCPDFYAYLLKMPQYIQALQLTGNFIRDGQDLNFENFSDVDLFVPPLSEQRAIAAFLDEKCANVDEAVRIKEAQIALLRERRQILIQHAVTRGLNPAAPMKDSGIDWIGQIPADWEVMSIRYAFKFRNNQRVPISASEREGKQGEYPYYGASGIIDHVKDFIFDEDLILIAEDGANLLSKSTPLAFVATGKYWVNNHAHILEPLFPGFKYWAELLSAADYTVYISGSAQPKLTKDRLGSIRVPVPPADERLAIISFIERESEKFENAITIKEDQITALKEYKTCLINAAVTGKIKVA